MMKPYQKLALFTFGLACCGLAPPIQAAPKQNATQVLDQAQLQQLGNLVGDARTISYGEESHGMQTIHEMVPQMFKYMVEKKGFRVFVFEVQWGMTEGLSDFMASDRSELGAEESYWLNGAFASTPIAHMLDWIRDWNRKHPRDQIQIAGYQPEQPVTDFREIFKYLETAYPQQVAKLKNDVAICRASDTQVFKTELDFILANSKLNGQGKPAFTPEESAKCLAGIDNIGKVLGPVGRSGDRALRFARLHQFSVASYFSNQRKLIDNFMANPDASVALQREWSADAYGRGDAARLVIYNELKALRFPKAKVFHWMHNWHAFRKASETDGIDGPGGAGIPQGTQSFGERLSKQEGKNLRVIATLVPCGTTCTEPPNSVEARFANAFGKTTKVVSFKRNPVSKDLGIDQAGSMWANQHRFGFGNVVLSHQADGVIYLPASQKVK